MALRLLWTGLTLVMAIPDFAGLPIKLVGGVLMVIGCLIMWLEKPTIN